MESSIDSIAINAAGRQRMLSQRLTKSLLELGRANNHQTGSASLFQEFKLSYELFDSTLMRLSQDSVVDRGGRIVLLKTTKSLRAHHLINHAYSLWTPIQLALQPLLASPDNYSRSALDNATAIVTHDNQRLLNLMDDLTNEIEDGAHKNADQFQLLQSLAAGLILVNFGFMLYFFRRQLNQLAESKSVLRRIMENMGSAIIVLDKHITIESGNRSAESMFGYAEGELAGMSLTDLLRDSSPPFIGKRKNGEDFPLDITLTEIPEMKRPLFIASLSDTSAQKLQEERLSYLAYHDSLTGLPNRLLFMDRLEQSLARAHRHKELVAILFIDLDHFKPVNDSMGHAIGDLLLQEVASRLTNCLREGDSIARLGGDEFTMIIEANDVASSNIVAEKILGELNREFILNDQTIRISASIGLSLYPRDSCDINSLLQCADAAMYRAKALGGNTCCSYPETQET